MDQAEKVLNIKIPENLHRRLKILAAMEGLSIKDLTIRIVEKYWEENKKGTFSIKEKE